MSSCQRHQPGAACFWKSLTQVLLSHVVISFAQMVPYLKWVSCHYICFGISSYLTYEESDSSEEKETPLGTEFQLSSNIATTSDFLVKFILLKKTTTFKQKLAVVFTNILLLNYNALRCPLVSKTQCTIFATFLFSWN